MIHPAVVSGALNFVHAPPKSSKSNLVFFSVCEILHGRDPIPGMLTQGTHPVRKVLILTEMPEAMTHAFFDLYDPDYELRGSGRLLVASGELKALLKSPEELLRVLTRIVEALGIDLVVIDTFVAFASWQSGQSLSESADTQPLINALLAIPATCWVVHHDRKTATPNDTHLDMLGATAIRAASSANLSIRLINEDSTLMLAQLEARDPTYLKWKAQCAAANARDEERPAAPAIATRTWYLRLDYDEAADRVCYVLAEDDLVPQDAGGTPKAERGDVKTTVNEALVVLTHEAARTGAPLAFALESRLVPAVKSTWRERDGDPDIEPGRDVIRQVLEGLPGAVHVPQGKYPGNGKAGGYGLRTYLPPPFGSGQEVPLDDGVARADPDKTEAEQRAVRYRRESEAAQEFLASELSGAPQSKAAVIARAKQAGHREKVLREAVALKGIEERGKNWALPVPRSRAESGDEPTKEDDA